MTHIYVSKLTVISPDNGLSPGWRQAIIWTNAGILLIGPLGTNFNEIFIEIHTFSFKKIHLKMSSGKWRPFCLGLNVLNQQVQSTIFPVTHTLWLTTSLNGWAPTQNDPWYLNVILRKLLMLWCTLAIPKTEGQLFWIATYAVFVFDHTPCLFSRCPGPLGLAPSLPYIHTDIHYGSLLPGSS